MRLTRVDLPTFGRPTTATTGSGPSGIGTAVLAGLAVEEGAVLLAEVEVLQAGAQHALDSRVVGQVLAHGVPCVGRGGGRGSGMPRGRPPLSRTFSGSGRTAGSGLGVSAPPAVVLGRNTRWRSWDSRTCVASVSRTVLGGGEPRPLSAGQCRVGSEVHRLAELDHHPAPRARQRALGRTGGRGCRGTPPAPPGAGPCWASHAAPCCTAATSPRPAGALGEDAHRSPGVQDRHGAASAPRGHRSCG